jgi:hypothetical protein
MISSKNKQVIKKTETYAGQDAGVTFVCDTLDANALASETKWRIKRLVDAGNDRITEEYADGGRFSQIADNRENLFTGIYILPTESMNFDGSTEKMNALHNAEYDFSHTDLFSFSVWVKPENTGNSRVIISKEDNTDNFRGYNVQLNNDGIIRMNIAVASPGNRYQVDSDVSVVDGEWSHICVTFNGSFVGGSTTMYINGVEVGVTINESTFSGSMNNTTKVTVGQRNGSAGTYYKGLMTELSI